MKLDTADVYLEIFVSFVPWTQSGFTLPPGERSCWRRPRKVLERWVK